MDPKFSFPFEPYEIQKKFMRELYYTIENNELGIFESPTGTGKSLSICCGALQWLRDSNKKYLASLENEIAGLKQKISGLDSTDNWLEEKFEEIMIKRTLQTLELKLTNHKRKIESYNEMKQRVKKKEKLVLRKVFDEKIKENIEIESKNSEEDEQDRDLILEDCEKEESDSEDEVEENVENQVENTKIYISSRTHSQLSQFIGEVKKTVFREDTRLVTLASRQHYCINSDVARLKNVHLINERCLDMQKSKTKSTSIAEDGKVVKKTKTQSCTSCPYYNHTNITRLKEAMLVEMMDIEDLVACGKVLKACPYYASRMALDDAEVVLVSHAGIVCAGARSGVSLRLHNNVLVLDEAHGLAGALESAHCAVAAHRPLVALDSLLRLYIDKYRARLSSRNLLALNQLSFVVGKLAGMVKTKSNEDKDQTIMTLEDFVIKAEIDHLNLRPLIDFCRTTRLAPKLHGFSTRYGQRAPEEEIKMAAAKKSSFKDFLNNMSKKKPEAVPLEKAKVDVKPPTRMPTETSAGSGLYAVLDFLERLCERSGNGRVVVQRGADDGLVKYLLLNPNEHFADVVKECRSVILAGGTMEPVSEFEELLQSAGTGRPVRVVKCSHVVPPGNVLAICLARGPAGRTLNLSYENRTDPLLLKEISGILRNVCCVVPGGVVCFLPSYSYENTLYEYLNTSKLIDTISNKKYIFREPKSSAEVDQVLSKFALAVRDKDGARSGALLLSVVGGKLSEGLNFSDDLGRCVIVVGMPYPNVKSPELREKIEYLNRTRAGAGQAHCDTLCMKAVNQCVGRALRHADDYACVLLVDTRYCRPHTVRALPSFVQKSLMSDCTFGSAIGNIAKFFSKHKSDKK